MVSGLLLLFCVLGLASGHPTEQTEKIISAGELAKAMKFFSPPQEYFQEGPPSVHGYINIFGLTYPLYSTGKDKQILSAEIKTEDGTNEAHYFSVNSEDQNIYLGDIKLDPSHKLEFSNVLALPENVNDVDKTSRPSLVYQKGFFKTFKLFLDSLATVFSSYCESIVYPGSKTLQIRIGNVVMSPGFDCEDSNVQFTDENTQVLDPNFDTLSISYDWDTKQFQVSSSDDPDYWIVRQYQQHQEARLENPDVNEVMIPLVEMKTDLDALWDALNSFSRRNVLSVVMKTGSGDKGSVALDENALVKVKKTLTKLEDKFLIEVQGEMVFVSGKDAKKGKKLYGDGEFRNALGGMYQLNGLCMKQVTSGGGAKHVVQYVNYETIKRILTERSSEIGNRLKEKGVTTDIVTVEIVYKNVFSLYGLYSLEKNTYGLSDLHVLRAYQHDGKLLAKAGHYEFAGFFVESKEFSTSDACLNDAFAVRLKPYFVKGNDERYETEKIMIDENWFITAEHPRVIN